jgi:hypothetical protein
MNLFDAAIHPASFCTSLMQVGAFILVMAEIFSGVGFDAAMADDEAE